MPEVGVLVHEVHDEAEHDEHANDGEYLEQDPQPLVGGRLDARQLGKKCNLIICKII